MVIEIDPVLLNLGPFTIRWSGLMIAVGIVAGLAIAIRETRRRRLPEDATFACAFWGIFAGIIGARLLHVVDRLDFYLQNPELIIGLQPGGLAVWGGIIGGVATGAMYAQRRRLPLGAMADIFAPAILVGLIIGRVGSIVSGDALGVLTSLPWGFVYVHPDALAPRLGEPTEPYPLYEMLWNGLLLGVIWRLRRRITPPGMIFLTFIIGYAVGRFFLTFLRQEQVWFLGLQEGQIVAIIVAVGLTPTLLRLIRRDRNYPDQRGFSPKIA